MNIEHRTSNIEYRMKKVPGENLMRRVKYICGTSVDDAKIDIQNEESLWLLDACLHHEVQHQNRSTMIRNLKSRIRKLEKEVTERWKGII